MGKAMAKAAKGPPHKHLHSRISFLHQAARYLSGVTQDHIPGQQDVALPNHCHMPNEYAAKSTASPCSSDEPRCAKQADVAHNNPVMPGGTSGLARLYTTQLRSISRKSTIRLTPEMKHSLCKRCHTSLEPGATCTTFLQNKSRYGRKPWADLLILECKGCGTVKRFPVGGTRQQRRRQRHLKGQNRGHESFMAPPG